MSTTRELVIRPAWDRTSADPRKNYGIHSSEMSFYVKGPEGGIAFTIYTGWHLPHVQERLDQKALLGNSMFLIKPMGADVSYHSKVPQYEGQDISQEKCELTGGPCYCDGSGLLAQAMLTKLIAEGSEVIWTDLEGRYKDRFCTKA